MLISDWSSDVCSSDLIAFASQRNATKEDDMGETREEGPELFDLRMSEGAQPLYERVVRLLEEVVAPMQEEYFRLGEGRADPWTFAPGQLEVLDGAKIGRAHV